MLNCRSKRGQVSTGSYNQRSRMPSNSKNWYVSSRNSSRLAVGMGPVLFEYNTVLCGNDQIIIEIIRDSEYFLCEKHVNNTCLLKKDTAGNIFQVKDKN